MVVAVTYHDRTSLLVFSSVKPLKMLSSTALNGPQSAPVTLIIPNTAAISRIQKLSDNAKTTPDPAIITLPMNRILLLPSLSATRVSSSDSITSPNNVKVINTPILESGNFKLEKNSARIRLGIPAVNMRNERSVMIMYASRPIELSDVMPKKFATRDKMVFGGIVGLTIYVKIPTLVKR
jgi:hypothetical protein